MHRPLRPMFAAPFVLAMLAPLEAACQKLPAPSRDVFRCQEGSKVIYSDTPCLGAQRVDVQPTRGMDSSTGQKRTGADVRSERQNESTAEALKPLFNETPEQRAIRHRRFTLPESTKRRCAVLDRQIPALEQAERDAKKPELPARQQELFGARQQFRSLGC